MVQGLCENYKSKLDILKVQLYLDMEFDMFGISVLQNWGNINLVILSFPSTVIEFLGQFYNQSLF